MVKNGNRNGKESKIRSKLKPWKNSEYKNVLLRHKKKIALAAVTGLSALALAELFYKFKSGEATEKVKNLDKFIRNYIDYIKAVKKTNGVNIFTTSYLWRTRK